MKKNLLIGLATGVLILGLVAESKATSFAGKDLHVENWYQGVSQPGYDRVFTVNPIPGAVELTNWGNTFTS